MNKKQNLKKLIERQRKNVTIDNLGRVPKGDIVKQQELNKKIELGKSVSSQFLIQNIRERLADAQKEMLIRLTQAKHQLDNRNSEAIEDVRNGEGL